MNILLSCVGRRSYLVRYFQQALAGKGKVIATNSVAHTPGMLAADEAIVVPTIVDPTYPDRVLEICRQRKIDLLCSLFDLDLMILSPLRERFEKAGVKMAVSTPRVIDICSDKWKTYQFGLELELDMPKTFLTAESALEAVERKQLSFPLIVKPRWGTGSIGIAQVHDVQDLQKIWNYTNKVIKQSYLSSVHKNADKSGIIIQEMICGAEYGLDIVNNLQGKYVCCFIKRKLAMRYGETDAAITVEESGIKKKAVQIANSLNHVGLLDVDIFRNEEKIYLLEMNPRFGGHYPFSHLAGANIPAALIAWAQGYEAKEEWLQVTSGIEGYKEIMPTLVRGKETT